MTLSQKTLIVHALLAVSPSGGGSTQYTLARKLMHEWEIEPDDETICHLITIAHAELVENRN
jgi:hypothetical protein